MKLKTILRALLITVLPTIEAILSLIDRIIKFKIQPMDLHLIFSIIAILGTFLVVLYLLNKYERVKREMDVSNAVLHFRTKHLFLKTYEDIEYFRLTDETDEALFNRLPQGEYKEYLKSEYKNVKTFVINRFNIPPSEATKLLDNAYGIKRKKK